VAATVGDDGRGGATEGDLDVTPSEWDRRSLYRLLTSLVVPRPIAWVSTVGPDGVPNIAPHSYFNLVSSSPPHVVLGLAGVRDTLNNIRASGEFVVNVVTVDHLDAMNATSIDAPPEVDEFRLVGLTAVPAVAVAAPRLQESPVNLECLLRHELDLGGGTMVVGEVVHVHVDGRVLRDGTADPELLRPLARLGHVGYAALGAPMSRPRPRWSEREQG
jgi:flavin reductase (DIM6/NTAB) family NADH-FMN oxidoreductase RutF